MYQLVFLGPQISAVPKQESSLKSYTQTMLLVCCYPKCHPDSMSHFLPALLFTEDNRPLLLSVISQYTFLITDKQQHQGCLYSCPSMSSCI